MISNDVLETTWHALGRQERTLMEAIAAATARISALRAAGEHEAANNLADERAIAQAALAQTLRLIENIEPKYFALVNAKSRRP